MTKKRINNPDWFDESDDTIKKVLDEKKKAHEEYLNKPSKENQAKFKTARRICQKEIRKIKDAWWSDKAK